MADVDASSQLSTQFSQADLPELLNQYYKRLFPYKEYYQWLSYGKVPKNYFPNREFSFTLKDDVYLRYQSFSDQKEMEKEIQKRCPYKIDIGAVFSYKPKYKNMVKASAFQAQEKELVFDIDMTDYDEIRTCCSGTSICNRCWPFMNVAIKIIDQALTDDFGFEHRLWVYSGRRGVHCWVCDEAARKLSQNERSAIAEYLTIVKGGENQIKKVNLLSKLHPSLERASEIIKADFKNLALNAQEILSTKERWDNVLSLVPDNEIQKKLDKSWSTNDKSSEQRWEELEEELENCGKMSLNSCPDEIRFQYCYPRLDVNVTKGLNHLLKSPFCIHPKTGRVCVPIDIEHIDKFDPSEVPTVSQLCHEIDASAKKISDSQNKSEGSKKKRMDEGYESALLKNSFKVFQNFLEKLDTENNQRSKKQNDDKGKTLDW